MPALHVLGELALEELRRAAGVLDDVDAARELAAGVRAALARARGKIVATSLVGTLLEQCLEAEHDACTGERCRRRPAREGGLRRVDCARDFRRASRTARALQAHL
jgi:hypothetical protein